MAKKLTSVLVANRGEIACRVIKAAKRLGLRAIAVYSDADAGSLAVRMADEAVHIGPSPAKDSYLDMARIIAAAKQSGADCIHPGYGFLSERAEFARLCEQNDIVFIGPPAEAIEAMGRKDAAKALVAKAGAPVVPGYQGDDQDSGFLHEEAEKIGFPVLIKAVAGGGGKGMKRVDASTDFDAALASAQREGQNSFGDPRVLVEKYVSSPRHIEIQIFADAHGNIVHLFERDCSLQRRHQKVMEEAPAPGMTKKMRAAMGKAAVEAARAVNYVGAGTVEFIVDASQGLKPDRFYFMEMNTRLQVEHPVTEAIAGLDLVALQFKVAAGEKLPFKQDDLKIDGWAVEARLYAEEPENGFLPSTGKLYAWRAPEGEAIRVDCGVRAGDDISPFYDPMIAKIIAHGDDRAQALDRLEQALAATLVAGPKTNLAFLRALCRAEKFRGGDFDTGFIENNLAALGAVPQPLDKAAANIGAAHLTTARGQKWRERGLALSSLGANDAFAEIDHFNLSGRHDVGYRVVAEGEPYEARLVFEAGRALPAPMDERPRPVEIVVTDSGVIVVRDGRQTRVEPFDPFDVDIEHLDASGLVKAPMHGRLVALFVKNGDVVVKGDRLAVVEAMKMEHVLLAPSAGAVAGLALEAGAQVAEGAVLLNVVGADETA